MVSFNPPLPDWKTEAIQRLGYGNLNKVGPGYKLELSKFQILGNGILNKEGPGYKRELSRD